MKEWILKSGRRMPFTPEQAASIASGAIQRAYDGATAYPLNGPKASKDPCTEEERREVRDAVLTAWGKQ